MKRTFVIKIFKFFFWVVDGLLGGPAQGTRYQGVGPIYWKPWWQSDTRPRLHRITTHVGCLAMLSLKTDYYPAAPEHQSVYCKCKMTKKVVIKVTTLLTKKCSILSSTWPQLNDFRLGYIMDAPVLWPRASVGPLSRSVTGCHNYILNSAFGRSPLKPYVTRHG